MLNFFKIIPVFILASSFSNTVFALPNGFVYLRTVAPNIYQDMRYTGYHNFVGRPIAGYTHAECILTREAAEKLAAAEAELLRSGYSLKVYDCYRPTDAVTDFVAWSQDLSHQEMKAEFYPHILKKEDLFPSYVALKSGHSRGSTVDLTIVALPLLAEPEYHPGDSLVSCLAPKDIRFKDNSIDMGTGYDCMDPVANPSNPNVSATAHAHRLLLRTLMIKYDFVPYEGEWWHFTLKNEPYPDTYFNFTARQYKS